MMEGMASGCPLRNLVPEMNDLIDMGQWEAAWRRLEKTNCFPEFTSRVCPALCEAACTCGVHNGPVATKSNEYAVTEKAFQEGWVRPMPPKNRTGKTVAMKKCIEDLNKKMGGKAGPVVDLMEMI